MNNPSLARMLAGAGVIGVGVLALLGNIDIINFASLWSTWWPLVFVAIGAIMFIGNKQDVIGPTFFVVGGLALLLNNLQLLEFNVLSLFWPLIIILIGWSIIRQGYTKTTTQTGDDNYFAMMSGAESRNTNKNYTGGKATAIMGGIDIDLRDAQIKKSASLEVFVLMGGIDIRVPRGWVVRSQTMVFLGGTENKADDTTASSSPVLTIVGNVILGGVTVRH